VHPYVSTGIQETKFGIQKELVDGVLEVLKQEKSDFVNFVGLHCHIGSTITEVSIFQETV
jgi:diaminopimelate decarboxylase